jgi:hypothetical protein
MKTVTFDETTHEIVPIVADELMLNAGEYFSENALLIWDLMLDAAPPYQSAEVNNGLREAAEQALEALRYHVAQTRPINRTEEAINALMQALAAPKGEE